MPHFTSTAKLPRTRRWTVVALATAFALALGMTACSPAGSEPGPGSGARAVATTNCVKAPTGSPIKTMTIASVNYAGPTYETAWATAKLYEQYINCKGGINGHPLSVITCDEKGVSTGTEACAREAVSEKVVAVVGMVGYFGGAGESILHAANIPNFGACCSYTPAEFNDSTAFPFGPDPITAWAGPLIKAAEDGCKNISYLQRDSGGADASNAGALQIMKAYGHSPKVTFTKLPITSQDFTAQITQATSNDPDCIIMNTAGSVITGVLPAFFQTGSKARIYGGHGNLTAESVKGFENQQQIKDATIFSYYSSFQGKAYDTLRGAIEQFGADTNKFDFDSLSGNGDWAAYDAFTQIASSIKGDINAASFLDKASTAVIDNGGMTPKLNFAKPLTGGIAPFNQRAFNRTFYYHKLDGTDLGSIDLQPTVAKLS